MEKTARTSCRQIVVMRVVIVIDVYFLLICCQLTWIVLNVEHVCWSVLCNNCCCINCCDICVL